MSEDYEERNEVLLDRIDEMLQELRLYFDTVQIFATKHENDEIGTTRVECGVGNWFARYGQIQTWINNNEFTTNEEN